MGNVALSQLQEECGSLQKESPLSTDSNTGSPFKSKGTSILETAGPATADLEASRSQGAESEREVSINKNRGQISANEAE